MQTRFKVLLIVVISFCLSGLYLVNFFMTKNDITNQALLKSASVLPTSSKINQEQGDESLPVIEGPDEVVFYLSQKELITTENLLDKYKARYKEEVGEIFLTEKSITAFYECANNHSTTLLTLKAKFANNLEVTKNIVLMIVDDNTPSQDASVYTITKTEDEILGKDAIVASIEKLHKEFLGVAPSEIIIIQNTYAGNEGKVGAYYIEYEYITEDVSYLARLDLIIEPAVMKDDTLKNFYIGMGVWFVSLVLVSCAIFIFKKPYNLK